MGDRAPEVFGPYLVREQLGRGGMATVHRAEQRGVEGFRQRVALKRLLPHMAEDPAIVEGFVHEARLASYLHHPNIAQTHDLGRVDGTYFIAMELVPGPTLNQVIRQCLSAAGSIPLGVALQIVIQLCDALEYAHGLCDEAGKPLGIIHRDVSPGNVILSSAGVVKLIDFGIAKVSGGARTQAGIIKGKLNYIAPEYTFGQIDHRADLFAVGIIAHELLTNVRLFQGKTDFQTLELVRSMPIQPPSKWNPEVPHDLDDIVMTALQRDPALRWQSATAMRAALANLARDVGKPFGPPELAAWVDWAFSQKPERAEESGLAGVFTALDVPSSASIELADGDVQSAPSIEVSGNDLDPVSGVVERRKRVDTGASTVVGRKLPRERSLRLLLLLVVLAAATAAAAYWGLPLLT